MDILRPVHTERQRIHLHFQAMQMQRMDSIPILLIKINSHGLNVKI